MNSGTGGNVFRVNVHPTPGNVAASRSSILRLPVGLDPTGLDIERGAIAFADVLDVRKAVHEIKGVVLQLSQRIRDRLRDLMPVVRAQITGLFLDNLSGFFRVIALHGAPLGLFGEELDELRIFLYFDSHIIHSSHASIPLALT